MEKGKDYYMDLPYTEIRKKISDESGEYYHARILELPGCETTGDTLEELEKNILEVKELYIESAIEDGEKIPEPVDENVNGSFLLRLPRSLKKILTLNAESEGVSLNQYILYKLSM